MNQRARDRARAGHKFYLGEAPEGLQKAGQKKPVNAVVNANPVDIYDARGEGALIGAWHRQNVHSSRLHWVLTPGRVEETAVHFFDGSSYWLRSKDGGLTKDEHPNVPATLRSTMQGQASTHPHAEVNSMGAGSSAVVLEGDAFSDQSRTQIRCAGRGFSFWLSATPVTAICATRHLGQGPVPTHGRRDRDRPVGAMTLTPAAVCTTPLWAVSRVAPVGAPVPG